MKKPTLTTLLSCLLLLFVELLVAQPAAPYATDVEPSRFDYGRMWTFEFAPVDYFQQTYGFRPDAAWLERARLSALRFSGYCSASFISPDGLVLTNHHCSRGEVGKVMEAGEDFDANGFYAATRAEERQVPGLYVTQLVKIADVTAFVQQETAKAKTDAERLALQDSALEVSMQRQAAAAGWEELEIEPVTYYEGGRYSLYGYKQYNDVRLVLIPELQLGYFGGDPDNFTYPRYNLDFTMWRVYGDDGQPLDTRNFYYPVNPDGVREGEPVFVIGNPGSTERYRTVAQLEYDRDYRYRQQLAWMRHRSDLIAQEFERTGDRELQETIFGLENSIKAISGIVKGMHDPYLMGKKAAMERQIKAGAQSKEDYWGELAAEYKKLEPFVNETSFLAPTPYNGDVLIMAYMLDAYHDARASSAPEAEVAALRDQITGMAEELDDPEDVAYLTVLLTEMVEYRDPGDRYVDELLDGRSPEEAAKRILDKTKLDKEKKLEKLLDRDPEKWKKEKDPLAVMARLLPPAFREAAGAFQASSPKRQALEEKIVREVFKVYGLAIPPDATFTLRLADGVVRRYDYNGTTAPFKTSYFGLYDRYYANDGEFPWSLPSRWQKPAPELLSQPLNFVSTTDIIGGNSGSAVINRKSEIVGLAFDGNIESLPGNFIFDETANRTVSVHVGGIAAALRYVFRADRILRELGL